MPSETENSLEDSEAEAPSFADDQPISEQREDKLDRVKFAKRVAEVVSAPEPKSGMVVAIYGAWGEGKTSVLRMIEEELKPRAVCVRFNPWQFSSREKLTEGFFITLAQSLGRSPLTTGEKISKSVNKYGNALAYTSDFISSLASLPPLIKPLQGLRHIFRVFRLTWKILSNAEVNTLKQRIEKILLGEEKRIVVFIDDIDRLDHGEIHEVFKLVKNTADFKNTTYVLAFDQDVVAASIGKQYGEGGLIAGRNFLEKIIQIPLFLPKSDSNLINRIFRNKVMHAFNISGMNLDQEQYVDIFNKFNIAFGDQAMTLRQVVRHTNGLVFALSLLKDEIHPTDFVLIEAVRHFYPNLHKLIRNNRGLFLKGIEDPKGTFLRDFDRRIKSALGGLDESETENLVNRLIVPLFPSSSSLFGKNGSARGDHNEQAYEKRACSEYHFDRYFAYNVAGNDVSDVEIQKFLDSIEDKPEADIDGYILSKIDSDIFSRFTIKLIHHQEKMSVAAARFLAMSFARLSSRISHERYEIYTVLDEAVSVVDAMLQKQDIVECIILAEDVIKASSSLAFAGRLFASIHNWKQSSGDRVILAPGRIEDLGTLLASRVKDAIREDSFFGEIERSGTLLIILRDYGGKEAAAILEASFNASDKNLDKFLVGIVGVKFTSEAIGPVPNEMDEDRYNIICSLIKAKVIVRMLKKRYGEEIDEMQDEMDRDTSLEFKLARQFMSFYNTATARKENEWMTSPEIIEP